MKKKSTVKKMFLKNRTTCLWTGTCLLCMVLTLLLTTITDHIDMPYQKLTENLIRLHPDSLRETSLKYHSLVNDQYANRVLHLRQTCRNSSREFVGDSSDKDVMHNIHIEQNHNLVYCQIQKVGSTFIRQLLSKIFSSSQIKKTKPGFKRLKQRKNIGFAELHSIIQNADKFMFVRDPYSRVLSGYVDKLFCPNTLYWRATGKFIVSQIRSEEKASKSCGHDVTFSEFVKYIIQSEEMGKHTDRHFTPLYEHCRPCQIPYDFIGKYETFKEDILFLINVWNKAYETNITFSDFETETAEQRIAGMIHRIFQMRGGIENCMSFYNASLLTWKDLQIRAILPIQEAFPFSAEYTNTQMTRNDFIEAAKKAIQAVPDIKTLKNQRKDAFIEAYSMISKDDLNKLHAVLKPDCDLFNYDSKPPEIFHRKNVTHLKYFDILH